MPLTNAEKQARHRDRIAQELAALRATSRRLLDQFASACDRGRCWRFADNLPEDPADAMEMLADRLQQKRLIVVAREDGKNP